MIKRFRVENFKSIAKVDVELSPVTVLVGRSGTGKSNFVSSIRCFRDILRSPQELQSGWQSLLPKQNPTGHLQFEIDFEIDGIPEVFNYLVRLAANQIAEERLMLGSKVIFHRNASHDENPADTWVVQPKSTADPGRGVLALPTLSVVRDAVVAYTALVAGIGCYSFSGNVLCEPEVGSPHPPEMFSGLRDDAMNYLFVLKDIFSDLHNLELKNKMVATLQRVNQSVTSVELNDIRSPSTVVVGHTLDKDVLALQLTQESDGFRRFYAHLIAMYQRPPKQTLVFEHPEDGIHPGALSLLAGEFKATATSGRGQVILTTHSPKLLDHFESEEIRVVELDALATRIGNISKEQREAIHENLLDPGELLTTDPARLDEASGANEEE